MRRVFLLGILSALAFLVLGCDKEGELRVRNRTASEVYVSVDNSEPQHLEAWSNLSRFFSEDRKIVIAYNGNYVFANSVVRDVRTNLVTTFDIQPDGGAIQIVNDEDVSLIDLYISPYGDPDWGLDNLAGAVLPGDTGIWTVLPGNWDIMLVDANNNSHYRYNLPVTINETQTLLVSSFGGKETEKTGIVPPNLSPTIYSADN
ncbi:MAG: hypothetical protein K0B87_08895 [Candidatus Syntrophosphaera sp.]|nr:hypothetical protein [Candidatus Syntrophosphaera sp.]